MVAIERPYTAIGLDRLHDALGQPETPALSIARIDRAELAPAESFGAAVDVSTPFPVGGISKLIAALTVLRLAADARLDLDADVNGLLKRWRLSVNDYTVDCPVTLRQLLSHQSGIVDPPGGFGPLEAGEPIPALTAVLSGRTRFHGGRVDVTTEPNREFSYSEAGYMLVQQIIEDATGLPFAELAAREVFEPLGLTDSVYPADDPWATFPAGLGLWASAQDLARLMISLGRSLEGDPAGILPLRWAQEMVRPYGRVEWAGLGVFVSLPGLRMSYCTQGRGPGFQAMLVGVPHLGQGVVVLSRGMVGALPRQIVRQVAQAYRWPHCESY